MISTLERRRANIFQVREVTGGHILTYDLTLTCHT